ncbi:nuclear body protein SP140 isoform X2 [Kryptolebias marmoratus]|uniref:Nuclear body protein SP140-like n=1 Tax=Kryptolebias marmoratus TaxID=37003 RepID=A0A3Q3BD96_KRYMA|nr:nuclear body protein SP140 isoform X2 [Kryptolebias marmoratus]
MSSKAAASSLKNNNNGDIWTWRTYKLQLPVTCGSLTGTLVRARLAKGEKCILVKKDWFTPNEFEKLAGKGRAKNWKLSIRCEDTPLKKLIEDGYLKSVRYKRNKQVKEPRASSSHSDTVSEEDGEDEESNQEDDVSSCKTENSSDAPEEETKDQDEQQQPESSPDNNKRTFVVTCGDSSGVLHNNRFSGKRGKSVRTETSWLTPEEFVNEALGHRNGSWRKDIEHEGKPLSSLLNRENDLMIHSVQCPCNLCQPEPEDLENQKNDDECAICKTVGELVVCDYCPRSFHKKCNVPHIEDTIIENDKNWKCTFCAFKANQKTEAVMSRQISQHMLECQYLLMYLCSAEEGQKFATNYRFNMENSSSFFRTPMWLDNIAERLQRNQYQIVGEFVSDVQFIFTECAKINQNNPEVFAMGEHLKQLFDQEFRKAFNIQDGSADRWTTLVPKPLKK